MKNFMGRLIQSFSIGTDFPVEAESILSHIKYYRSKFQEIEDCQRKEARQ